MRAIQIHGYGSVEMLKDDDILMPARGEEEVLIKVHAVAVNPIDTFIRQGFMKHFVKKGFPIILGAEVAGEVVKTGEKSRFKVGDKVFSLLPGDLGGYAEFVAIPERAVGLAPNNLRMIESAALPVSALTSLQAFRNKAHIKSFEKVLINGASGGVGCIAVQLAVALGQNVTAVCSEGNYPLAKRLGAHHVIDYQSNDFTKQDKKYDVIFDCVATRTFKDCKKVLKSGGRYISTRPIPQIMFRQAFNFLFSKKAFGIVVKPNVADLEYVKELAEQKKLLPIIDKVFNFTEMAEAHKYSGTGRAKGKIIVKVVE